MFDYLIIGAGLYGSTIANILKEHGKSVAILDKRQYIGGNIYTEKINDIIIHKHGAHIFHTNNKKIWEYINQFAEFNSFINSPIANYKGELYSLPFNMYTFNQMWGVTTPQEAMIKIEQQRAEIIGEPRNLEEQAISLVGRDIYEKLIKGYTEKQWGRDCKELPAFIIKRLPLRFTFDNNYFNAKYQGIPIDGYTAMIKEMLKDIYIFTGIDFIKNRKEIEGTAKRIIYTGSIDELFDFKYGMLEYRSLKFKQSILNEKDFQGNAVVNYTDNETNFTRIIEHKHFDKDCKNKESTVITKEYPLEWREGLERYYPINDDRNNSLYEKYRKEKTDIIICGRLGDYKYYDMDKTIENAMKKAEDLL